MKPVFAIVIAGMLCGGCASTVPSSAPVRNPLDQADAKMAASDYRSAQALYAEFANANPSDPQAARARAIKTALDRLLLAQSELERVSRNEELLRAQRDIAERHGEVERLKAENAKLRADLERLRNIDLQTLPGARK